jgi:hypothetical protein
VYLDRIFIKVIDLYQVGLERCIQEMFKKVRYESALVHNKDEAFTMVSASDCK